MSKDKICGMRKLIAGIAGLLLIVCLISSVFAGEKSWLLQTNRTIPIVYSPDDSIEISWDVKYDEERYGQFNLAVYNVTDEGIKTLIDGPILVDERIATWAGQYSPRKNSTVLPLPKYGKLNGTYEASAL